MIHYGSNIYTLPSARQESQPVHPSMVLDRAGFEVRHSTFPATNSRQQRKSERVQSTATDTQRLFLCLRHDSVGRYLLDARLGMRLNGRSTTRGNLAPSVRVRAGYALGDKRIRHGRFHTIPNQSTKQSLSRNSLLPTVRSRKQSGHCLPELSLAHSSVPQQSIIPRASTSTSFCYLFWRAYSKVSGRTTFLASTRS